MKLWQAFRAMERGRMVRRRPWPAGNLLRQVGSKFEAREGRDNMWERRCLCDLDECYDDWVIVRKKPKAPAPLRAQVVKHKK